VAGDSFDSDSERGARPVRAGVVDGQQVAGYRDEERVNPESGTETYAAVKLEIENWRWAGFRFICARASG
jgi:glucose-6-phosphate 1-dehydrogenase